MAEGDGEGEAEDDADQDAEDSADDKSDCQYKVPHYITVYITLPNGDEEIITDFEICFTDKTTRSGEAAEKAKEDDNGKNKDDNAGDNNNNKEDTADMENIEFEFKLAKLVNYIKKQGYPVENSFVSYYSADFQVQVNCGLDPISPAITICPTDLEEN